MAQTDLIERPSPLFSPERERGKYNNCPGGFPIRRTPSCKACLPNTVNGCTYMCT
ncbi:uncharacterized protein LY79DRAFT_557375 [Colletotrichum navitas]|uniref:Uncharacterized protein n=1 Tax=Colletotrichum navitas TaxID=681940 RepID=A0AAD8PXR4_9PEZI|nr:uncharacterized protein LY79DRAFT_557375 [Colletotrichum navitas]KAK1586051.1 hypothetical protein LY79DRAFT_557375 [Colletotrichum navitas]